MKWNLTDTTGLSAFNGRYASRSTSVCQLRLIYVDGRLRCDGTHLRRSQASRLRSPSSHCHRSVLLPSYLIHIFMHIIAVISTGLIGWLFNIVLILCSGPVTSELLGGSAVIKIMTMRIGKAGTLVLWAGVCATAFFVVQ
jgi:hypothetical protein